MGRGIWAPSTNVVLDTIMNPFQMACVNIDLEIADEGSR